MQNKTSDVLCLEIDVLGKAVIENADVRESRLDLKLGVLSRLVDHGSKESSLDAVSRAEVIV